MLLSFGCELTSPQALGFRCVVSSKHDQTTLSEVSTPATRFGKQAWRAHIAPESTYLNEDSSNEELASVLAVLKYFGYAIEQLNGTNAHSLSNIITRQSHVHE
ncbi:hypothetical protein EDD85DRAFT_951790 [Armillaria nabsnona]|nr:hypothetical protein EDD85DRAFT_951790 [Armillaria nabsnona]